MSDEHLDAPLVFWGDSMRAAITEDEIAGLLADKKPISAAQLKCLMQPKMDKNSQHYRANIQLLGQSGREYTISVRRNANDAMEFSVILSIVRNKKQFNLIRCNGHHALHPNNLERSTIPADTCHIHRVTERYHQFGDKKATGYAEATSGYDSFEGAVDYMARHFGVQHPDGYKRHMFDDLD